jgi:hypothetical protein
MAKARLLEGNLQAATPVLRRLPSSEQSDTKIKITGNPN